MLGTAQSARADPVTLTPGGSVTFTYQSPNFAGSVASATFNLSADGTTLTVTLTNNSTNGTFASGLGFDTTPNVALFSSSATATFIFTAPLPSLTIDQSIAHLTSLPNGQSEKPPGTSTHAPEPATLLLLGTGMPGVGAKVRSRKRRQKA